MARSSKDSRGTAAGRAHVRPVTPVTFASDEPDPGVRRGARRDLQRALEEALRASLTLSKSTVGGGRLVYYRANDPAFFVAPAAFVKIGVADHDVSVWKTWERGAPEVAFELVGRDGDAPDDDRVEEALDPRVARYHEAGVRELVVLDLGAPSGRRLRVWDRIDGDFVERVVDDERTPSFSLDCELVVRPVLIGGVTYDASVRLTRREPAHGGDGDVDVVPTAEEARGVRERAQQARELEQQASLKEARSRRDEAQARGDARAAEMSSSNDRTLASLKRRS